MTAPHRAYIDATEPDPFESGISKKIDLRERGNAALSEARVLARYSGRDDELTKPSVMLLDWTGDDEVTVRWDDVRHGLHPKHAEATSDEPDDDAFASRRFRGIGARTGGILLGIVLGVAVTIGTLAIFAPRSNMDDVSVTSPVPGTGDVVSLRTPVP